MIKVPTSNHTASKMSKHLKIIDSHREPTPEAIALKRALEGRGVTVYHELYDGHKHIDLAIPRAKINVEVDGIRHLTDPHQILADLARGYYSHKKGFDTMHIQNNMINNHLPEIAEALAEASKIRERTIHVHIGDRVNELMEVFNVERKVRVRSLWTRWWFWLIIWIILSILISL